MAYRRTSLPYSHKFPDRNYPSRRNDTNLRQQSFDAVHEGDELTLPESVNNEELKVMEATSM